MSRTVSEGSEPYTKAQKRVLVQKSMQNKIVAAWTLCGMNSSKKKVRAGLLAFDITCINGNNNHEVKGLRLAASATAHGYTTR